ncbi:carbonic anhydrase [Solimonas sp. K1W22B-7]|uniref:carbonic anhydrase n=1 Tax=Solimonas sp. K1W22B-7 TaxID=2303331 RepID=UPI000E33763E|nr:carbonic anhydrase [Solimonas sp. K1W22B-7]AXQ30297.1 carbonic anhydrase [Solimonas sp. K1W22B-7]
MDDLQDLLDRNERWADRVQAEDPEFFRRLVGQQTPKYLWIGCSDSRVPANEIVDLQPGELFVHRNIANVVPLSDVNAQSVIQFAVEVLKIEHIMVVGHYRCSGVHAALHAKELGGVSDFWLSQVRAVASRHADVLNEYPEDHRREAFLCELNVLEQAFNVCSSVPVRNAWNRGQKLHVHGWIYRLADGRLRHLDFSVDGETDLERLRTEAVAKISAARRDHYGRKSL